MKAQKVIFRTLLPFVATTLVCLPAFTNAPPTGANAGNHTGEGGVFESSIPNSTEEIIKKFTTDMYAEVQAGRQVVPMGLSGPIHEAFMVLDRAFGQNNPMFVADAGAGKTTSGYGISVLLNERGQRVLLMDWAAIESAIGSNPVTKDAAARRVVNAIKEHLKANPTDVLFIDEIHRLIESPHFEDMKEILTDKDVRVMGATDLDNFREVEKDYTKLRRFEAVFFGSYSRDVILNILAERGPVLAEMHGVQMTYEAMEILADMTERYLEGRIDQALRVAVSAMVEMKHRMAGTTQVVAELNERIRGLEGRISANEKAIELHEVLLEEDKVKQYQELLVEQKAELEKVRADLNIAQETATLSQTELKLMKELREAASELKELKTNNSSELGRIGQLENGTIPELKEKIRAHRQSYANSPHKIANGIVQAQDLAEIVAKKMRTTPEMILASDLERIDVLEKMLSEKHVGNQESKDKILRALKIRMADMKAHSGPIGSILLDGPTGVGKTLLAQILAEGMVMNLIRVNMAEFATAGDVWKFVGSGLGYEGNEKGGLVTEEVRKFPFSVLLLDEFEKAHPDVQRLLLAAIDDGKFVDGQGREISTKNLLIVITVNSAADYLATRPGSNERFEFERGLFEGKPELGVEPAIPTNEDWKEMDPKAREALVVSHLERAKGMASELQGRLAKVSMQLLTPEEARRIAEIELKSLADYVEARHDIKSAFTADFVDQVAKSGYDEKYGARSMKNFLDAHYIEPLTDIKVNGEAVKGDVVVFDTVIQSEATDIRVAETEKSTLEIWREALFGEESTRSEVKHRTSFVTNVVSDGQVVHQKNYLEVVDSFTSTKEASAARASGDLTVKNEKALESSKDRALEAVKSAIRKR